MPRSGDILSDRYKLKKRLGKGGFGMVFEAMVLADDERPKVAIKIENVSKTKRPQIHYEYRVLKSLRRGLEEAFRGRVPMVHEFLDSAGGDDRYQCIVMEKMGTNLQEIFDSYRGDVDDGVRDKPFTAEEVFMVADQAIDCVRAVHSCGFVHRDIKPENFCVRHDDSNRLCIVDFGLSKRFRDSHGAHIPHRMGKGLLGTPRYTSIRCHEGHELSRRDDMESLLYMVLYFFRPGLPWQGTRNRDKKKKYKAILQKKKRAIQSGELFMGLGEAFATLLRQVHDTGFDAEPGYNQVKSALRTMLSQKQR